MESLDNRYFELNHLENAINNLEMMEYFLTHIHSNWKWKWTIVAAHQALYGFLICALKGTAAKLTVTLRDVEQHPSSEWHRIGAAHAWDLEGMSIDEIAAKLSTDERDVEKLLRRNPRLIGIRTALWRMQRKKWLAGSGGEPLVLMKDEQWALNKLIGDFRNEFEHFVPKEWLIDVSGMPTIMSHALRVIEFVAVESNAITMQEDTRARIVHACERVRAALQGC